MKLGNNQIGKKQEDEGEIMIYKCNYPGCGKEFEQKIVNLSAKGKSWGSNQVKCPRCGNFLKNKEGKLK